MITGKPLKRGKGLRTRSRLKPRAGPKPASVLHPNQGLRLHGESKPAHTSGAMRAASVIAGDPAQRIYVHSGPDKGWCTREEIADLISRETGDAALLEALKAVLPLLDGVVHTYDPAHSDRVIKQAEAALRLARPGAAKGKGH